MATGVVRNSLACRPPASGSWTAVAERAAGFVLLLSSVPVIVVAAAILALLSRRLPLVRHLRVGQDNAPFWMLKLRTMWSEDASGRCQSGWIEKIAADPPEQGKQRDDARVTSRFAAFCRRHSIDELPQLWHVVRGEMSLVGPRPLTRCEIERYYGDDAGELLSLKPGLTGLWQVSGRSVIPFPQRAALDLELVRSKSAGVYWKILLRTIPGVVSGRGAW